MRMKWPGERLDRRLESEGELIGKPKILPYSQKFLCLVEQKSTNHQISPPTAYLNTQSTPNGSNAARQTLAAVYDHCQYAESSRVHGRLALRHSQIALQTWS